MPQIINDFEVVTFSSGTSLREWLDINAQTSKGIWVRIYKKNSKMPSVTFEDVLDEGLCFGWSESKRLPYDKLSYLQLFTPRKKKGTTSARNREHAIKLIKEERMTDAGLAVLDLDN